MLQFFGGVNELQQEMAYAQFKWPLVVIRLRDLSDWYHLHSAGEVFACRMGAVTPMVC